MDQLGQPLINSKLHTSPLYIYPSIISFLNANLNGIFKSF
jgi:hypothetical protein